MSSKNLKVKSLRLLKKSTQIVDVYIPALSERCVAAKALEREGMPHEVVLIEDDFHYSRLISELWQDKDGFIILEHDVVPWPGALNALLECNEIWCGYCYPFAPHIIRGALGCTKFSKELIELIPEMPGLLENKRWNLLDGIIFPAIIERTKLKFFHIHEPPLAHVKG